MMTTPLTLSSVDFDWRAGKGTSTIGRSGIGMRCPNQFYMKSSRTGEMRLFVIDSVTMEENEFFDGEGFAYISEDDIRVHIWN